MSPVRSHKQKKFSKIFSVIANGTHIIENVGLKLVCLSYKPN